MHTLLIVDDEDIVRSGLRNTIPWIKYGFKVVDDCASGLIAEDLIRQYKPDLLITDIKMPDISGLELIRRAKQIAPHMQYIILSAYDSFAFAQQAILYHVVGYLLKPVVQSELDALMEIVNSNLKSKPAATDDEKDTGELIDRIRIYIHENYQKKLTLEHLSSEFYITQSYISTLFRAKMNQSIVDYIQQVRIKEAKRLLSDSSYRIADIASIVGYDDYTYFCKVFKKINGNTPLDYRLANKK